MDGQNDGLKLREAIVAGIFYPEDPSELGLVLGKALEDAAPARADALAILSPHAGFEYTLGLEALAWKAAAGRNVDTVVVVAPRHRPESGDVYLPESDVFDTPLGPVRVDRDAIDELESCGTVFRVGDIPHFEEHAIEVQLPFLRKLFPDASLVPILTGRLGKAARNTLARAMDLVFFERLDSVLFVVTTDLASSSDRARTERDSASFLATIAARDTDAMLKTYDGSPCGAACVSTLLSTLSVRDASWTELGTAESRSSDSGRDETFVRYAAGAWFPA